MPGKTEETTGFIYRDDTLLSDAPLRIMLSKGLGPESSIEGGCGAFQTHLPICAESGESLKMELLDGTYEIEITSLQIETSGQCLHEFRVIRRLDGNQAP